jgi:hypothetical protein
MTLGRRLAVLAVAVLMALMMVAGPALAVPGNGQGYGRGIGGDKHKQPRQPLRPDKERRL